MKTIIVLTDFSKAARNAANASVDIALQLRADILLLNSYLIPFAVFSMEGEGRTMVDTSLIASTSESGLKKEARRLRRLINTRNVVEQKPNITIHSSIDSIGHTLKNLNSSIQIEMLVIGVHQTSLPLIFSAIDFEPLLKQIHYPMLIMPRNHKGFLIQDFVFATDLKNEDLIALRLMRSYAKAFGFRIHVCHVSKPVFVPDFIEEDKVQKFGHHIALLGEGNITFTNLKGRNVVKTLNEFTRSIQADMIGITHNPHSFGWKLLNDTHTSKLIRHQKLPMVIFPQNFLNDLSKPMPI
ncbi:universal stress protein [Pedobacter insulae]|uniref:Universal stress protein family protein n=1 Tax=Pedobacter insulae TaxID=414048 RepID=A0A1I2XF84_9SPHI|nr:hypothetical protein [Pedobacter insulae]SFH12194.1 Universal stress protein family protein [Pedobacter insulae]